MKRETGIFLYDDDAEDYDGNLVYIFLLCMSPKKAEIMCFPSAAQLNFLKKNVVENLICHDFFLGSRFY